MSARPAVPATERRSVASRRSQSSLRRRKLDVHGERPSFLQRLTGLRLGFCRDTDVKASSSTDESVGNGIAARRDARAAPQQPRLDTQREDIPEESEGAVMGRHDSQEEEDSPPETRSRQGDEATDAVVTAMGTEPPPPPPPPPAATTAVHKPLVLSSRQASLQKPPLATSSTSTATAAMRLKPPSPMPPPLRHRLESTATSASRHRARAHESFAFSMDSLHMILQDQEDDGLRQKHTSSTAQSQAAESPMPMLFVDLATCRLERDFSALPVDLEEPEDNDDDQQSFDYSSSSSDDARDVLPRGTARGSAMGNADGGGSLVSNTSPLSFPPPTQKAAAAAPPPPQSLPKEVNDEPRKCSPTSVIKIDEEVPSWMLAWTGQQTGQATEPILVETEELTPTTSKLSPTPAVELAIVDTRQTSLSSLVSTMTPKYLVPGAEEDESVIFSAWMAASASDLLVAKRDIGYDDVVHVILRNDGVLLGRQYDDRELFRIHVQGKVVQSHFLSKSLGYAVSIEEGHDDGSCSDQADHKPNSLCTLLPVSLPPHLFLDNQGKLVDEMRFEKYRHALAAPFRKPASNDDDKQEDDSGSTTSSSPAYNIVSDAEETDDDQDPIEVFCQFAPGEQHDAVLYLQFLLDAQSRSA